MEGRGSRRRSAAPRTYRQNLPNCYWRSPPWRSSLISHRADHDVCRLLAAAPEVDVPAVARIDLAANLMPKVLTIDAFHSRRHFHSFTATALPGDHNESLAARLPPNLEAERTKHVSTAARRRCWVPSVQCSHFTIGHRLHSCIDELVLG